jgi:hypothetical protein
MNLKAKNIKDIVKMIPILTFINTLRETDIYIKYIFSQGSCYQFYLLLKAMYPDAKPYIDNEDGHIASLIDGVLYDIEGLIPADEIADFRELPAELLPVVTEWSFSRNHCIQLSECPFCEEPIIYSP